MKLGIEYMLKKKLICTIVSCWLLFFAAVTAGTEEKLLGDESDGSRAAPVHLINLYDEQGQKIAPEDDPLLPFSTAQTCGKCHSYGTISKGWHFNAADPNAHHGRLGQPWIFADRTICTQVPLSYRRWPGTYHPEEFGITTFQFTNLFGRYSPGGGAGELESDDPDEIMRGFVSGKLEINCLACHNSSPYQDQAEFADQVAKENFRWSAAASCEFASVHGLAKKMPDTYDPLMPGILEDPKLVPPNVTYRKEAFDHKNRVFFDVGAEISNNRCYFCHSTVTFDENGSRIKNVDEDVHVLAGLNCVHCHSEELEHNTVRANSHDGLAAALSCEDCHLEQNGEQPSAGRMGAVVPKHAGIPPIHFDKLTCTACHSGPWPEQKSFRVKTSRAHGLGGRNVNKSPEALPHIVSGVFARQGDGKIGPHNLIWPAFWATEADGKVTPIEIKLVEAIVAKIISADKSDTSGDWPSVTEQQIKKILSLLAIDSSISEKPVYICGGKLYSLDEKQELAAVEHDAADPYLWPIAHDVRGAGQSLGVRSCKDCHSTDSPFFFGSVMVDSPLAGKKGIVKKMIEFQNLNQTYTKAFAMSFVFRPLMKIVAIGSSVILMGILLLYALKALSCICKIMVGEDE